MSNITKLATSLRAVNRETKKAIINDRSAQRKLGYAVTKKLRENIDKETANLAWGEGKQVDNKGKVSFRTSPTTSTVRIFWTGPYVEYIEYGAGIIGAQSSIPYQTDNYAPQPDGHMFGDYWAFRQNNQWYFSRGWEPKAPFYKTMLAVRLGGDRELRLTEYEKAINKATRKAMDKALKGVI